MGTQWTNKYAILRDLSFAQGRQVPAKIVGSVGSGQKPPAINIKEETEEEFYQTFAGDGELCTKPDLDLIKEMLNLVRENDPADVEDTEKVVVISKLNPHVDEFLPSTEVKAKNNEASNKITNEEADFKIETSDETNHVREKIKSAKKPKQRNAAIISLLEKERNSKSLLEYSHKENLSILINETETVNEKQSELKLLKPNDFMIEGHITDAVEKVDKWLHKPAKPEPITAKTINLSPMNMFKKKPPPILSLDSTCMFKRKSDSSSIKSSDSEILLRQADNVFVPSSHAGEYYKKFLERRQVQEMAQEDIWKRAERLMKEIDAKRLKENEEIFVNTLEDTVTTAEDTPLPFDIPGLTAPSVRQSVLLPQHRHDLPEECKVCLALAKYRQRTDDKADGPPDGKWSPSPMDMGDTNGSTNTTPAL